MGSTRRPNQVISEVKLKQESIRHSPSLAKYFVGPGEKFDSNGYTFG